MPRTLTLSPRKVTTDAGTDRWTVLVPAWLSETGKRQRRFFERKTDAKVFADQMWIKKTNQDRGVVISLSLAQQTDATKAYELLAPHPKLTLLGVVHEYLDARTALEGSDLALADAVKGQLARVAEARASVPLGQLFDEYIQARASKSLGHRNRLTITRDKFAATVGEALASEIEPRDLEPVLDRLSPSSRNLNMRILKAVFNFGIKRGYLAANPITRLDFADHERKPVQIIEPERVEAMLCDALENDIGLLPFLVLGFYCGIRPNGELQKLDWASVHLDEAQAVIESAVSKTKKRRFVDLSENAKAWLDSYAERGGTRSGPVVPFSEAILRTKRRDNWRRVVGVKDGKAAQPWIQTGMRHTFCSAWLAAYQDVNKLVLMSGHDSPTTMWNHYHLAIKEAEAARFWAIRPPQQQPKKIVAFAN